jgi:single-strand DNA-binding protein
MGSRWRVPEWHRIELWDKLADVAAQYLKKGNTVYVEGRIRTEEWTDKDGIVRRLTKIRGTDLTLLGGGRGPEEGTPAANPAPKVMAQPTAIAREYLSDGDDLPF